jgi:hypothetical protein
LEILSESSNCIPIFILNTGTANAAPEFTDRMAWRAYNVLDYPIIPTGLALSGSGTPLFIIGGVAAAVFAARFAVKHRKRIEELPIQSHD